MRSHWLVESMHWNLTKMFAESERKRVKRALQGSQMCLNMQSSETTLKASIKHKRMMCTMNSEYLLKVLTNLYLLGVQKFPFILGEIYTGLIIKVQSMNSY